MSFLIDENRFQKELHLRFNILRLNGEWFKYDRSIIDFFETLKK